MRGLVSDSKYTIAISGILSSNVPVSAPVATTLTFATDDVTVRYCVELTATPVRSRTFFGRSSVLYSIIDATSDELALSDTPSVISAVSALLLHMLTLINAAPVVLHLYTLVAVFALVRLTAANFPFMRKLLVCYNYLLFTKLSRSWALKA